VYFIRRRPTTPALRETRFREVLPGMNAQTFGARLRQLRERAGLTQKELAERSGVPQANIARWEQGVRTPLVVAIPPLVMALGVSTAALFEPPSKSARQQRRGRGRPPKVEPRKRRRRGRPREWWPVDKLFGLRLMDLRQARGLTQVQLAQRIGMSDKTVSRMERGVQRPSWQIVQLLADALRVSCDEFRRRPSPGLKTPGPGRPPKPKPPGRRPRKRPSGRPRKAAQTSKPRRKKK
jgi:transcriptional regulator with XRE-family HTH domain